MWYNREKIKKGKKMESEYKNLEEFLYALRKEKDWSYDELAHKLDLDYVLPVTVKKWEKGLKYPELKEIYRLAEVYNTDPNKILYYKQLSLKAGMDSIHTQFIKWVSFLLNVSFITAKYICIGVLVLLVIFAFSFIHIQGERVKTEGTIVGKNYLCNFAKWA